MTRSDIPIFWGLKAATSRRTSLLAKSFLFCSTCSWQNTISTPCWSAPSGCSYHVESLWSLESSLLVHIPVGSCEISAESSLLHVEKPLLWNKKFQPEIPRGRVGTITHEEKHPGSFEMVHVKDSAEFSRVTFAPSSMFTVGCIS